MRKDINSFLLLQKYLFFFFFSFHLSEENVPSNNIRQTPVGLRRLCKAVKNDNTLKTNHKCLPTPPRNNRHVCLGSLTELRHLNIKEHKCQNEVFRRHKETLDNYFLLVRPQKESLESFSPQKWMLQGLKGTALHTANRKQGRKALRLIHSICLCKLAT